MRMMVSGVLVLAALGACLLFCPPARSHVEAVLLADHAVGPQPSRADIAAERVKGAAQATFGEIHGRAARLVTQHRATKDAEPAPSTESPPLDQ